LGETIDLYDAAFRDSTLASNIELFSRNAGGRDQFVIRHAKFERRSTHECVKAHAIRTQSPPFAAIYCPRTPKSKQNLRMFSGE